MGDLIADLVHQPKIIQDMLKYYKEHDELMAKLISISEKFSALTIRQNIHLCILRSDYMIDKYTSTLKLVEYNTIATSFGCLAQKTVEIQSYIRTKYG